MVSQYTWPNFRGGDDRAGTTAVVQQLRLAEDVQYGRSKLFIKSPQTVFQLEEERAKLIPGIVIFLQVRQGYCVFLWCLWSLPMGAIGSIGSIYGVGE